MYLIFCVLQNSLYFFEIKAPPLSNFICFGTPYISIYSLRNVITVSWFVFLQILVTGQRLFLSAATRIYGVEGSFLLCKFPVKSSWISSPDVLGGSIFVFFLRFVVFGISNFYRRLGRLSMFSISFRCPPANSATRRSLRRCTSCWCPGVRNVRRWVRRISMISVWWFDRRPWWCSSGAFACLRPFCIRWRSCFCCCLLGSSSIPLVLSRLMSLWWVSPGLAWNLVRPISHCLPAVYFYLLLFPLRGLFLRSGLLSLRLGRRSIPLPVLRGRLRVLG